MNIRSYISLVPIFRQNINTKKFLWLYFHFRLKSWGTRRIGPLWTKVKIHLEIQQLLPFVTSSFFVSYFLFWQDPLISLKNYVEGSVLQSTQRNIEVLMEFSFFMSKSSSPKYILFPMHGTSILVRQASLDPNYYLRTLPLKIIWLLWKK